MIDPARLEADLIDAASEILGRRIEGWEVDVPLEHLFAERRDMDQFYGRVVRLSKVGVLKGPELWSEAKRLPFLPKARSIDKTGRHPFSMDAWLEWLLHFLSHFAWMNRKWRACLEANDWRIQKPTLASTAKTFATRQPVFSGVEGGYAHPAGSPVAFWGVMALLLSSWAWLFFEMGCNYGSSCSVTQMAEALAILFSLPVFFFLLAMLAYHLLKRRRAGS